MALRQQLFQPDTCTCRVLEEWDEALPLDQVVHTLVAIQHRGDEHSAILDDSLYSTIREENRRKILAVGIALATATVLANDPATVAWSFTAGRTLQLTFPTVNVSNADKTAIQSECDATLGLGLVTVQ